VIFKAVPDSQKRPNDVKWWYQCSKR